MNPFPLVVVRDVVESDLPIFFEHQREDEANCMAGFPARGHDKFNAHWTKLRRDPTNVLKTIVFEDEVAGNIVSWLADDKRLVGYWVGREFWGQGIATAALREFLGQVNERPLYAFVAKSNVASIRVLEKCEFVVSGVPVVVDDGVEELLFELSKGRLPS